MERDLKEILTIFEAFGLQNFSWKSLHFLAESKCRSISRRIFLAVILITSIVLLAFFGYSGDYETVKVKKLLSVAFKQYKSFGTNIAITSGIIEQLCSTKKMINFFNNSANISRWAFSEFRVVMKLKKRILLQENNSF